MFKITSDEIELGDVVRAVEAGDAGAIVHFLGVVRNNTEGRGVSYLEYEAYPQWQKRRWRKLHRKSTKSGG